MLFSCGEKNSTEGIVSDSLAISIEDTLDTLNKQEIDTRIFGDNVTEIDTEFSFVNSVFDYGASYDFNGCEFNFECDCCSGNLILYKDSVFYYVDHCMADLTITRGHFNIDKNKITFVSDGIIVNKEYDPSKEYKPNVDEFSLADSITKPYSLTFKIKSCNGKALLVDDTNKEIWIAALTNQKAEEEIGKLEKDGILDRFKRRDSDDQ